MFNSDKIESGMVKQYASNTKKFYDRLEECEECQAKLASIWKHTYQKPLQNVDFLYEKIKSKLLDGVLE